MDRAIRRSLSRKAKARVEKIIRLRWRIGHLANNPKFVGKMARTPKMCSCYPICCNQRKFLGPTRQEILQEELHKRAIDADEYISDWIDEQMYDELYSVDRSSRK